MTEEEKKAKKKQAQHEAWKRWYSGPKGAAYRQLVKERRALAPAKT